MDSIKLISTGGPYGDACCSYDFVLSREMTLKEFVDLIIQDKDEWGDVRLGWFDDPLLEYSHGKVKFFVSDLDFMIKKVGKAHGGWSNMDYIVEKIC